MSPTVVFLWISAAPAGAALTQNVGGQSTLSGNDAQHAASLALLREYGARRGLNFVELGAVASARPSGSWASSGTLADELEGELEQAATALSALEEAAALERLTRVEQTVLAHPDLPQAAWLLAETLALRARAAATASPELASRLESQRLALEGQRATAFGESASPGASPAPLSLRVRGLARTDELELDGARRLAREVELWPGLHQVRVFRSGRLVHAQFYDLPADAKEMVLDVPALVPCSADDLGAIDAGALASGAPVPSGALCPRFALVRPAAASIEVALCSPLSCGPFVRWQARPDAPFRPIVSERGLPGWAGFAIAGATAIVATSLVLWQAGAFDEGRPNAVRWEYGGLDRDTSAIRF